MSGTHRSKHGSRSNAVFQITVEQRPRSGATNGKWFAGRARATRITFIDLAGSESSGIRCRALARNGVNQTLPVDSRNNNFKTGRWCKLAPALPRFETYASVAAGADLRLEHFDYLQHFAALRQFKRDGFNSTIRLAGMQNNFGCSDHSSAARQQRVAFGMPGRDCAPVGSRQTAGCRNSCRQSVDGCRCTRAGTCKPRVLESSPAAWQHGWTKFNTERECHATYQCEQTATAGYSG